MKERFRGLVEGAALATDTTFDLTFSGGAMTMKPNATLEGRWVANAEAYGVVDQGPDPNSGSTDMGNVSWTCPTIHPELSIAPEGTAGSLDPLPRRRRDTEGRSDDAARRDPRRPGRLGAVRRSGAGRRGLAGLPRRGLSPDPRRGTRLAA